MVVRKSLLSKRGYDVCLSYRGAELRKWVSIVTSKGRNYAAFTYEPYIYIPATNLLPHLTCHACVRKGQGSQLNTAECAEKA
jgi:hypothetical protein